MITTKKKTLIVCPNCELGGEKSILGEITPEGNIEIWRYHQGITRIIGQSFGVACGKCNEAIYIKGGGVDAGTLSHQLVSWTSRVEPGSVGGAIGTPQPT